MLYQYFIWIIWLYLYNLKKCVEELDHAIFSGGKEWLMLYILILYKIGSYLK